MIKFIYSKNGLPISDHLIEETILYYYNNNQNFKFSNELVIYGIRILAADGKIDSSKFEVYEENKSLGKLNKYFQFESYLTKSYFDDYLDILVGRKFNV